MWVYRRTELMQCLRVNAAFEVDHFIDRPPEVNPANTVKFRFVATIKSNGCMSPDATSALLLLGWFVGVSGNGGINFGTEGSMFVIFALIFARWPETF